MNRKTVRGRIFQQGMFVMRKYLKRADQYLLKKIESFNNFFSAERILIFTLLMIALHAVISLCFNTQIYRDVAGVYAWYGREFAQGTWWDIPISKVPPLNIFLCGLLGARLVLPRGAG